MAILMFTINGLAIIHPNSIKEWRVNDIMRMSAKSFQLAANLSDKEMAEVILKRSNVE